MMVVKRNLLFQGAIFRFHAKLWEGMMLVWYFFHASGSVPAAGCDGWLAATPGGLRRSTKMEASKKPSFNLIRSRIHSKVANQHATWPSKVISRTCKPYLNSCKIYCHALLDRSDFLMSWAKSHTVTYSGILTSQINPFSIWQTLSLGTATHDALCSARLPSKGLAPWYSCRKRWIDSLSELQSKSLELTLVGGFKTHQFQLFYWKCGLWCFKLGFLDDPRLLFQ